MTKMIHVIDLPNVQLCVRMYLREKNERLTISHTIMRYADISVSVETHMAYEEGIGERI